MKAQMEELSQSTQTYFIYIHCLRIYFKPQNITHCEIIIIHFIMIYISCI